jgi:hypothetical protein
MIYTFHIGKHANDVVIITRSETRMRHVYREIEEKTQTMGLLVNEKKPKYMIMSVSQKGRQTQNLKVGDKYLKELQISRQCNRQRGKD